MAYRDGGGAVIDRTETDHCGGLATAPSIVPALLGDCHDTATPGSGFFRHLLPRCPEIDCIRHLLPPAVAALAELRSAETGVSADRVLIAENVISAESYAVALADHLGMTFEPLNGRSRDECPLSDERLIESANTGLLPINAGDGFYIAVAPDLVDARRLVTVATSGAEVARRIRITSAARLRRFVARSGWRDIERRAVDELRITRPEHSAGTRGPRARTIAILTTAGTLAAIAAPVLTMTALDLALGAAFLAWTGLRLLGLLSERPIRLKLQSIGDDRLPIYSIVVALYREAAAVRGLVAALRNLNYPAEKLDIKIVLEPDDGETLTAVSALRLGPPFEIVIAPPAGPRTKPKALNAALQFVRGSFVAVYDAEDRPEPDQLRLALDAFVDGDARLACVQARLTVDNAADSWLTRMFTAEYAGLFDVLLPGLAARRLPLPLGGSSNHFRTAVLRLVGGWDPYNVTEDADLGMRLARFGYRTTVIASTTYEEAPVRFGPWLRQRTRWLKGWMQTWLVHMRAPRRLARELGGSGFAAFQLLVGGTVLAALVHSLFTAQLAWMLVAAGHDQRPSPLLLGFYGATLLAGYLISAALGVIGLARRRLLNCAWALLLMPVYWLLLSLAAWRALIQLLRAPYHWEKTEHGLARTSRLAARARRRARRAQR